MAGVEAVSYRSNVPANRIALGPIAITTELVAVRMNIGSTVVVVVASLYLPPPAVFPSSELGNLLMQHSDVKLFCAMWRF